jgi:pyruvate dehydrogenase E2 component (dihydrolipoamide acetyltransferase)
VAIPITVPRLGWSMEEGTFVEWLKRDGEFVRVGEPLYVLESEKASEPVDAIDSGFLRLTVESPKAGDVVKVGQTLAFFAAEGEELVATALGERGCVSTPSARQVNDMISSSPAGPVLGALMQPRSPGLISSPRARRVARELGVDLANVTGSGRGGRVRERDVRAASPASGGKLIPHTKIRKTIAARMVAGITVAAPVTLHTRVDASKLVEWRERLSPKPGFSDLILKFTATALLEHPMLQAQWRDDALWLPPHTNIALAVDTDAGLLAPVVRNTDQLSIQQIAHKTRELAENARSGNLHAEEQRDATFTVTNLGMYDIDEFTPIITLPQCAVLGVGRIADGRLTLSLTFDHRVVDGAPAARFLQSLCTLIARGES